MFLKKLLLRLLLAMLTVLVVALAAEVIERRLADDQPEADNPAAPPAASLTTSIQLTAPEGAFSALVYSNGTTTLAFSQAEDGTWYWDGDREFPLDTACINAILAELATLEPSMTLSDSESLEPFGLDEQFLYLTARNADGTRLHLDFGNTVPDGTARYVLMDDDPDAVYVLETGIPDRMNTTIYDMMLLPQLPQLVEADFSSITVRGAHETVMVAFTSHAESTDTAPAAATVSWRAEGANITDYWRLRDLIADLSALKLTRCENFKPSDASVTAFGLDSPTATVEITHGKDQTLTLIIGNETLAGGAYYVQLKDDTTIYSMDQAMLDTALSVAAYGLEGAPEPPAAEFTDEIMDPNEVID